MPLNKPETKPLFIPLFGKHFDDFAAGAKTDELRLYGDKWNEQTCPVGRDATLSYGYGKFARMQGRIRAFKKTPAVECSESEQRDILEIYKRLDVDIARISIDVFGDVVRG